MTTALGAQKGSGVAFWSVGETGIPLLGMEEGESGINGRIVFSSSSSLHPHLLVPFSRSYRWRQKSCFLQIQSSPHSFSRKKSFAIIRTLSFSFRILSPPNPFPLNALIVIPSATPEIPKKGKKGIYNFRASYV